MPSISHLSLLLTLSSLLSHNHIHYNVARAFATTHTESQGRQLHEAYARP